MALYIENEKREIPSSNLVFCSLDAAILKDNSLFVFMTSLCYYKVQKVSSDLDTYPVTHTC